ncbi:glycosyltransferase family 4 protein [Pseudalkalibacillus salsuginis]|uniref:glycosyltransferase family 4 protein n=1 Tax=Pseudalkalibacillus salsuginis TaxID=2910972 RepID=UPI001F3BF051|nr:glycosyltransferase family 4 protein [Pseudalkalibacillus salsuginis]MCF6410132.1 glycosyltransferase family 4 protein [Pseudalkalibacillus salsuginis]
MKICHLTSVHSGLDTRIVIKECQSLAKVEHDVTYIVPNEENRTEYGVKIVGVPSNSRHPIQRIRKTTRAVFEAAKSENADVYHFHDPELIPIGLKLKKLGKKVIYDVHEDVPEQILSKQWIPKKARRLMSKGFASYEKKASGKFDAVVTATPYIAEKFRVYNQNTVTIHNYPILSELMDEDHSSDISASGDTGKVVYLGGIYRLRGIIEMINSIERVNQIRNTHLILGGSFAPPTLRDEVEQLPGWKYVDYRGFLSRVEVKRALSDSHVGLVLLHPEPRFVVSLPIKMFEYMSAGLPVIASNFPLWKEIVEDNDCGICVDPLDEEEISRAILELLDDPERCIRLGENGRRAVADKYNWKKESERLIQLYNNLN